MPSSCTFRTNARALDDSHLYVGMLSWNTQSVIRRASVGLGGCTALLFCQIGHDFTVMLDLLY